MNNKLPISKETFIQPKDEKHFRDMLYDLLQFGCECNEKSEIQIEKLEVRIGKLEDREGFIPSLLNKLLGIFGR